MTNATESLRFRSFADLHSRSWTVPTSREKAQIQSWIRSPQQGASEQQKEVFSLKRSEGNKLTFKAHSGCYEVALWKEFILFVIPRITLHRLGNSQVTLENTTFRTQTWRPPSTSTLLAPKVHWACPLEPRQTHKLLHMGSKAATWTHQTVTSRVFRGAGR